jgi:hypothetical protein
MISTTVYYIRSAAESILHILLHLIFVTDLRGSNYITVLQISLVQLRKLQLRFT